MKKLTEENFIKARDYILSNSDDIMKAWYVYNFENNDTDVFMDVLAKYQHENGGFGKGIYYEFDYQGPCLKSTEIAIRYILNLKEKPSASHPVIQKMMKYILENYLTERGNWREVMVPEINEGVHCRWVRFKGEVTAPIICEEERLAKYDANQKVCFATFCSLYSELVPQELYNDIIKYPINHILKYWDENSPDYREDIFDKDKPYNFEYFQDFVLFLNDKETAKKLADILCQNPAAFMELDYSRSDYDYVHLPCDSIKRPDSVVYSTVRELFNESLDYRINQQSEDGRWPLGWSFGEDEELQKLQLKYETYLSLEFLVKLNRFGRI